MGGGGGRRGGGILVDLFLYGEKTRESRKEGSWTPEDGD